MAFWRHRRRSLHTLNRSRPYPVTTLSGHKGEQVTNQAIFKAQQLIQTVTRIGRS